MSLWTSSAAGVSARAEAVVGTTVGEQEEASEGVDGLLIRHRHYPEPPLAVSISS